MLASGSPDRLFEAVPESWFLSALLTRAHQLCSLPQLLQLILLMCSHGPSYSLLILSVSPLPHCALCPLVACSILLPCSVRTLPGASGCSFPHIYNKPSPYPHLGVAMSSFSFRSRSETLFWPPDTHLHMCTHTDTKNKT